MRICLATFLAASLLACATPTGQATQVAASSAAPATPATAGEKLAATAGGFALLPYDDGLDALLRCEAAGKTRACLPKAKVARRGEELELVSTLRHILPEHLLPMLTESMKIINGPIEMDHLDCARALVRKTRVLVRQGRCAVRSGDTVTNDLETPIVAPKNIVAMVKQNIHGADQAELLALLDAPSEIKVKEERLHVLCDAGGGKRIELGLVRYDGVYAMAAFPVHHEADKAGVDRATCKGVKGVDLSVPKTLPAPVTPTADETVHLLARLSPYRPFQSKRAEELFACAAKGALPSCLSWEDAYFEAKVPAVQVLPASTMAEAAKDLFEMKPLTDRPCAEPALAFAAKALAEGRCVASKQVQDAIPFELDAAHRKALLAASTGKTRAWVKNANARISIGQHDLLCFEGKAKVEVKLFTGRSGSAPERVVDGFVVDGTLPGGKRVCNGE